MCSQATEPTRRLFFALWPDAAVREALAGIPQERLGKQARPVAQGNLHITLAFAGAVTAAVHTCLSAAAGQIRGAPFELVIDRLGHWPRPRILWAGPSHTPRELGDLAGSLREVLADCGLVPETRPYQAHITLARKVRRGLADTRLDPVPWSIGQFCLVESVTDPAGVRYEVLASWPLSA